MGGGIETQIKSNANNINTLSNSISSLTNTVNTDRTLLTTEHVVGTWIDGKPIYEKTWCQTGINTNTSIILQNYFPYQPLYYTGLWSTGQYWEHFLVYNNSGNFYVVRPFILSNQLKLNITNYTVYGYIVNLYYIK